YETPKPPPYVAPPDTGTWLSDPSQRDEFCVRHGPNTEVFWHDGQREPVLDYGGSREKAEGIQWCSHYMQWSPSGSYMATIVPAKGVIVWGGENYEKLSRFPHTGVDAVVFSPGEKYMLTNNFSPDAKDAIKIFEVTSGRLLRAFPLYPDGVAPEEDRAPPSFEWSHDDSYIARLGKDLISIYTLPDCKLLGKKSLLADGCAEFQWSPAANVLAFWCPEQGNAPAHVDLISIPTRKQMRQKNLFNVSKCNMSWSTDGEFLGVKVLRHTRTKKTVFNNFELFRVNAPGVPVEMLDIKDAVMAFGWEPGGTRFALVHAENKSATRANVSFYDMNKEMEVEVKAQRGKNPRKAYTKTEVVQELNLVTTLKDRQCNTLYWSPAGNMIVLASLGESSSGSLEFYDVSAGEVLAVREHYRATEVVWDPSGRTLATCVVQPLAGGYFKFAMDNGYIIWGSQGKQLFQQAYELFYQFAWRPRKCLLGKEEKKEVVKNLKKYERNFDKADKERTKQLQLEMTKEKREQRKVFRDRLADLKEFYRKQHADRVALNGYDSDDDNNYSYTQAVHETVLESKEITVNSWA
ncbi:hypothetical protein TeGR_g2223, partial [Tetraparma gracilis]